MRPPQCSNVGVKRGTWTPEEDILLASYIQKHGTGNWNDITKKAGLMRRSKSCWLRWTNYLRPGIKRGDFMPQEEKTIIDLQALLGNKWAAIASFFLSEPTMTSRTIGTHKKVNNNKFMPKELSEKTLQTDVNLAKKVLSEALSTGKPSNDSLSKSGSSSEGSCMKTESEVQIQLTWLESWLLDDTEYGEEGTLENSVHQLL